MENSLIRLFVSSVLPFGALRSLRIRTVAVVATGPSWRKFVERIRSGIQSTPSNCYIVAFGPQSFSQMECSNEFDAIESFTIDGMDVQKSQLDDEHFLDGDLCIARYCRRRKFGGYGVSDRDHSKAKSWA